MGREFFRLLLLSSTGNDLDRTASSQHKLCLTSFLPSTLSLATLPACVFGNGNLGDTGLCSLSLLCLLRDPFLPPVATEVNTGRPPILYALKGKLSCTGSATSTVHGDLFNRTLTSGTGLGTDR